ncbi:MAG: hypothetical protein WCP97_08415 [bacterium]
MDEEFSNPEEGLSPENTPEGAGSGNSPDRDEDPIKRLGKKLLQTTAAAGGKVVSGKAGKIVTFLVLFSLIVSYVFPSCSSPGNSDITSLLMRNWEEKIVQPVLNHAVRTRAGAVIEHLDFKDVENPLVKKILKNAGFKDEHLQRIKNGESVQAVHDDVIKAQLEAEKNQSWLERLQGKNKKSKFTLAFDEAGGTAKLKGVTMDGKEILTGENFVKELAASDFLDILKAEDGGLKNLYRNANKFSVENLGISWKNQMETKQAERLIRNLETQAIELRQFLATNLKIIDSCSSQCAMWIGKAKSEAASLPQSRQSQAAASIANAETKHAQLALVQQEMLDRSKVLSELEKSATAANVAGNADTIREVNLQLKSLRATLDEDYQLVRNIMTSVVDDMGRLEQLGIKSVATVAEQWKQMDRAFSYARYMTSKQAAINETITFLETRHAQLKERVKQYPEQEKSIGTELQNTEDEITKLKADFAKQPKVEELLANIDVARQAADAEKQLAVVADSVQESNSALGSLTERVAKTTTSFEATIGDLKGVKGFEDIVRDFEKSVQLEQKRWGSIKEAWQKLLGIVKTEKDIASMGAGTMLAIKGTEEAITDAGNKVGSGDVGTSKANPQEIEAVVREGTATAEAVASKAKMIKQFSKLGRMAQKYFQNTVEEFRNAKVLGKLFIGGNILMTVVDPQGSLTMFLIESVLKWLVSVINPAWATPVTAVIMLLVAAVQIFSLIHSIGGVSMDETMSMGKFKAEGIAQLTQLRSAVGVCQTGWCSDMASGALRSWFNPLKWKGESLTDSGIISAAYGQTETTAQEEVILDENVPITSSCYYKMMNGDTSCTYKIPEELQPTKLMKQMPIAKLFEALAAVSGAFQGVIGDAISKVGDAINKIFEIIGDLVKKITGVIGDLWNNVMKNLFEPLIKKLMEFVLPYILPPALARCGPGCEVDKLSLASQALADTTNTNLGAVKTTTAQTIAYYKDMEEVDELRNNGGKKSFYASLVKSVFAEGDGEPVNIDYRFRKAYDFQNAMVGWDLKCLNEAPYDPANAINLNTVPPEQFELERNKAKASGGCYTGMLDGLLTASVPLPQPPYDKTYERQVTENEWGTPAPAGNSSLTGLDTNGTTTTVQTSTLTQEQLGNLLWIQSNTPDNIDITQDQTAPDRCVAPGLSDSPVDISKAGLVSATADGFSLPFNYGGIGEEQHCANVQEEASLLWKEGSQKHYEKTNPPAEARKTGLAWDARCQNGEDKDFTWKCPVKPDGYDGFFAGNTEEGDCCSYPVGTCAAGFLNAPNDERYYLAMQNWTATTAQKHKVLIRNVVTKKAAVARPMETGPSGNLFATGPNGEQVPRIAGLSPELCLVTGCDQSHVYEFALLDDDTIPVGPVSGVINDSIKDKTGSITGITGASLGNKSTVTVNALDVQQNPNKTSVDQIKQRMQEKLDSAIARNKDRMTTRGEEIPTVDDFFVREDVPGCSGPVLFAMTAYESQFCTYTGDSTPHNCGDVGNTDRGIDDQGQRREFSTKRESIAAMCDESLNGALKAKKNLYELSYLNCLEKKGLYDWRNGDWGIKEYAECKPYYAHDRSPSTNSCNKQKTDFDCTVTSVLSDILGQEITNDFNFRDYVSGAQATGQNKCDISNGGSAGILDTANELAQYLTDQDCSGCSGNYPIKCYKPEIKDSKFANCAKGYYGKWPANTWSHVCCNDFAVDSTLCAIGGSFEQASLQLPNLSTSGGFADVPQGWVAIDTNFCSKAQSRPEADRNYTLITDANEAKPGDWGVWNSDHVFVIIDDKTAYQSNGGNVILPNWKSDFRCAIRLKNPPASGSAIGQQIVAEAEKMSADLYLCDAWNVPKYKTYNCYTSCPPYDAQIKSDKICGEGGIDNVQCTGFVYGAYKRVLKDKMPDNYGDAGVWATKPDFIKDKPGWTILSASRALIQPGDILVFTGHVGIAKDKDTFIDGNDITKLTSLNDWETKLTAIIRYTGVAQ